MDRGAWQAIVHGVTKSWMQLNTHPHTPSTELENSTGVGIYGLCGYEGSKQMSFHHLVLPSLSCWVKLQVKCCQNYILLAPVS